MTRQAGSPPRPTGILFDTPTDERWEAASRPKGIDPRLLESEAGRRI